MFSSETAFPVRFDYMAGCLINKKSEYEAVIKTEENCKTLTMEEHPDYTVVEMDSVEGKRDSTKVLLTLFFRNSTCMLAFLREANTARSMTEIIDDLYSRLGRELFCRMFPVILTDRGSEFTDPASIEFDEKTEQSIRPSTVQFLLRRGSSLGIENAGYSRKRSDDF